jgi:Tfp pilus assembly protein PilW
MRGVDSRGFSLAEAVVATGASVVLLGGAVLLFQQAMGAAFIVTQRAEMQQNARVAINMIVRDAGIAATGMPVGGIQLPSGAGSVPARFACDAPAGCHVTNNSYPNARLYPLTPGDGLGPVIGGVATDVVTIAYRDSSYALDQYPLTSINQAGTEVHVDPLTSPPINDPAAGITAGDLLVLCNANGCAAAVVTATQPASQQISLDSGDALNMNQPAAAFGNVASLATPPGSGNYPQTRAYRALVVTYYIDASNADSPTLMRQVSAHTPVPAAERIDNLQITYDTFDENTSVATANLPDAGGSPSQIRKMNVGITARPVSENPSARGLERVTLGTAVNARNLSFKDRYQ